MLSSPNDVPGLLPIADEKIDGPNGSIVDVCAGKALSRRRHDDTLVLADGQNGDWTPHDLRRPGATMMQALGVSLNVIDRCQNHLLAGSRVRHHYLHHNYAEESKRAWNLLGDRLSAVLSSTYEHTPNESMLYFPAYAASETRTLL